MSPRHLPLLALAALLASAPTSSAAEQRLTLGATTRARLGGSAISVDPSRLPLDAGWALLDDHAFWAVDAQLGFGRDDVSRFGPDPILAKALSLAFSSAWSLHLGPLGHLELGGVLRLDALAGPGSLGEEGTVGVIALDRLLAWRSPSLLGNRLRVGLTAGLLDWPMTVGDTRTVSRAGAVFLAGLTAEGATPYALFVEDDLSLLPHVGLVLQARVGWLDTDLAGTADLTDASFSALLRVRL